MEPQDKKLKLNRRVEQDLKLWFFIVHPDKPYIKNEAILTVVGYDLESANVKARQDAKGMPLTYTGQNAIIKDLISQLHLGESAIISVEEPEQVKLPPKEKFGKEQFKSGLLMALKEFIKDKKDKEILSKIIEKL